MRKMSVCFSTRSSLRGRQRRERKEEKCLSFLLKNTLFLSLSLFLFKSSFSFFLRYIMFWLSIRFFFLSFRALLFVVGEIKRWSSLSLFSLQGEIGNHIQSLSLSLSLLRSARFGKPDLPLECSAAHKKREG